MADMREILYFQESERRRIAEGLHDTTAQELVCLLQQMELANLYMDKDPVQARLEIMTAKKQIRSIIDGIRETIYDLRPVKFDDNGCSAAFRSLVERLSQENMDINVHFEMDDLDMVDETMAISVYRIICEACQNIIKHSHAENMWVRLRTYQDHIRLAIRDDGIGFQKGQEINHFGMQFIKERVFLMSGRMDIETGCGGTAILIDIPK